MFVPQSSAGFESDPQLPPRGPSFGNKSGISRPVQSTYESSEPADPAPMPKRHPDRQGSATSIAKGSAEAELVNVNYWKSQPLSRTEAEAFLNKT